MVPFAACATAPPRKKKTPGDLTVSDRAAVPSASGGEDELSDLINVFFLSTQWLTDRISRRLYMQDSTVYMGT